MRARIKVAAAREIGRMHENKGIVCQDYSLAYRDKKQKFGCVVVADGAGSRSRSDRGAELAAQVCKEFLLSSFDGVWKDPDLFKMVLLESIIQQLENAAQSAGVSSKEYASTLLFAAVRRDKKKMHYVTGHLGDGVIIRRFGSKIELHSIPDNDQFANITYFTTSSDAKNHFRIHYGSVEENIGFLLASDGVSPSLFCKKTLVLSSASKLILSWIANHRQDVVRKALEQNLHQVFKEESFDDLSMGVLATL